MVWNTNNLREISVKTQAQKADFNIFEGVKVHAAPEFVLTRGRVVVYEYELDAAPKSGAKAETAEPFSNVLYDAVADFEKGKMKIAVNRNGKDEDEKEKVKNDDESDFGVTTPRSRALEEPILNKRLGIYQRPMSAHGIRNQQDSTFSLSGGYEDNRRASVKVNAPPGGGSRGSLW